MNKKNISFEDACESLEDHVRRIIAPPITRENALMVETRKRNNIFHYGEQKKRFRPFGRGNGSRTYGHGGGRSYDGRAYSRVSDGGYEYVGRGNFGHMYNQMNNRNNSSRGGYAYGRGISRTYQSHVCEYCGRVGHGIDRCFNRQIYERGNNHEVNYVNVSSEMEKPALEKSNRHHDPTNNASALGSTDNLMIDSGVFQAPK